MKVFLYILFVFFCFEQLLSTEHFLTAPKSVSISLEIRDANTKQPIIGAKIFFFEDQQIIRSNKSGIAQRMIATVKDSISIRISAQGYAAEIRSISVNNPTMTILLKPKDIILDDVFVRSDASNNGIRTRSLENVQVAAIFEGKKSELINVNELLSNKSTAQARQIFARVPGLNIWENDQSGLQLSIGGRGMNPNRTAHFNTRINGYDMAADALGYPENYYTPPIELVDRIEIVRGAASMQYGPQFGGMVNFKLKSGHDTIPFLVQSSLFGGSYGFMNAFTSMQGSTDERVTYYIGLSYKKGDGWRPNADYNAITAYANIGYQPISQCSLTFESTYHTSLQHLPGGLTDRQFLQDPRMSYREYNWFDVTWNINAIQLLYEFTPMSRVQSRFFNVNAIRSSQGNLQSTSVIDEIVMPTLIRGEFMNIGNETRFMHTFFLDEHPSNVLIGWRAYKGDALSMQGIPSNRYTPSFSYADKDNPEQMSINNPGLNCSFFAETAIRPSEYWTILPGIRYEYVQTGSNGRYTERIYDLAGNQISSIDNQESRTLGRSIMLFGIGTSFRIDQEHEVYANYARNFRAITFSDMRVNNPNLIIDSSLDDEIGFNTDIGMKGYILSGLFYFDISAFYLSYENRIGTVLKSDRAPLFLPYRYRTNIGATSTVGIESIIETDIFKLWSLQTNNVLRVFLNTSYIQGTYTESSLPGIQGNAVEYIPAFTLRSGIELTWNTFHCGFTISHLSKQFSDASNAVNSSNASVGEIPAYTVADLSFRYTILSSLSIEAHINNLFNQLYFTRRAESYPGPGIIPAEPRMITIGIISNF
ncbi:MAG: TonB-dependent receptor [Bacteroidetes bacterium]|nr:TonB-dependent receptor [Bacteroidota bacterium]